jgi:hypothetical protein
VLGEDAATNNIGSVTLLHDRVRVQADSEEADQIHSQFSRTQRGIARFGRHRRDPAPPGENDHSRRHSYW